MKKLSVVIPAYNEEASIKKDSLEKVWNFLKRQKYAWEVIIVNDASTDETLDLCLRFTKKHRGFKVLDEPHRGKGGSVIAGMLRAGGEIILFCDMDQATPIEEFEKFTPKF